MNAISYRNLHFPPSTIQRAVWLYARFNLSLRDVEELMAERGVEVSYEAILAGRQPIELTAKRLKRVGDLPVSWAEQRRLLGFA
jgi:transposase-like protein